MSSPREDFLFLNSDIWLKYTQARYLPPDEIRYRLSSPQASNEWKFLKKKIIFFRKMGAIPLFIKSIDKHFWYFPSDCISKKVIEIERRGSKLYEMIKSHSNLENEFMSNATLEEAISSAIYEGANSTRSKAKALLTSGKPPKNKDEWMLINNLQAMKWMKENSENNLSIETILEIHKLVTSNTLTGEDANYSGKIRDNAVYVKSLNTTLHEGVKHDLIIPALMEAIEVSTNHKRFLNGLIKGILLHYLIAYIHPFFDGNGRTARTLFYLKAIKSHLKFVELLSISADLKERGRKYEASFKTVEENDWDITYFIDFCLDSMIQALNKVEAKVNYLFSIAKLKETQGLTNGQIRLLQIMALNRHRKISIGAYGKLVERSREFARKDLIKLEELGLLIKEKVSKKYVYRPDIRKLKEILESTF